MMSLSFLIVIMRIAALYGVIASPYNAAIFASHVVGLNDVVVDHGRRHKYGTLWLVATGITGSRLRDLRTLDRPRYGGTAIHEIDARWGRIRYHAAVEAGVLSPDTCVFHRDDGRSARREAPYAKWSTRGPYELSATHAIDALGSAFGIRCFPVELVDVPIVAAFAAATYAKQRCVKHGRTTRKRPCDAKWLRCLWAGIGRCKRDAKFRASVTSRFKRYMHRARKLMRAHGHL